MTAAGVTTALQSPLAVGNSLGFVAPWVTLAAAACLAATVFRAAATSGLPVAKAAVFLFATLAFEFVTAAHVAGGKIDSQVGAEYLTATYLVRRE